MSLFIWSKKSFTSHGYYSVCSLAKANALAKYAREEKKSGRVLFMCGHERSKGVFHCLDMNDQKVRDMVLAMNVSESLEDVFENLGFDYSAGTQAWQMGDTRGQYFTVRLINGANS